MRHGKKGNHLGRKTAHRHAMLANMASSLIVNKRIETTVAKAKALRMYVEPLLTKAKEDSTHNRRVVFSYLTDKEAIKELFGIVAEKIASRPGGYTRIIKLPNRLGDNAEMCMMELVDFNEVMLAASAEKPTRTRRSRRGGTQAATAKVIAESTKPVVETVENTEAVEVVETEVEETVTEVENTTTEEKTTDEASDENTENATKE
jgi:large subunit ribosomal protein L17